VDEVLGQPALAARLEQVAILGALNSVFQASLALGHPGGAAPAAALAQERYEEGFAALLELGRQELLQLGAQVGAFSAHQPAAEAALEERIVSDLGARVMELLAGENETASDDEG
jgi:hypothetical protein